MEIVMSKVIDVLGIYINLEQFGVTNALMFIYKHQIIQLTHQKRRVA